MNASSFYHVAIKVDDLDRSEEFYRSHFDGSVLQRGDASASDRETAVDYVALEVADKRVYLFDKAPYEAARLVDEVPTGFLHFGFVVDGVSTAYEQLTDAGVDFIMEPGVFGDLKIAFFTDPAGVRVELLEHV